MTASHEEPARRRRLLVVGAGFAGAVVARSLADEGHAVRLIEKRPHIAGNAFDKYDQHGILVHEYGPHIFHTRSHSVLQFLSRFTGWRFYEHRVLAQIGTQLVPLPINRTTISMLLGRELTSSECEAFLAEQRVPIGALRTSEDVVLNSVGPLLCELFFRGYTRKQWGRDLSELSAGVAARIPTRSDDDDRYFSDSYQLMPINGYTAMFDRMLRHDLIEVELNVDYFDDVEARDWDHLIYTGPLDAFFDYCHGRLPYRSLRFEHLHYDVDSVQAVGTINFPNDYPYTRQTEFKHLTGQDVRGTSVVREYAMDVGEPYYPVPCDESQELLKRYNAEAKKYENVVFVGRLAQYRYYNMDQVVAAAMDQAKRLIEKFRLEDAVRNQTRDVQRIIQALRTADSGSAVAMDTQEKNNVVEYHPAGCAQGLEV